MPDTPVNNNNRNLDFLDTGYANLRRIDYNAPAPQSTGAFPVSPNPMVPLNPKAALDSLFANLREGVGDPNIGINQPIKTPLAQTARYSSSIYGYDPFNPNLETQYGDRQGFWNTLGNYTGKFLANTTGAFIESLATIPQVINAIAEGDISKLYDNGLTNGISDWLENLETSLPTYQTSAQKNNPILSWIPLASGSLHNWGMLLQNLGYTAGSIAGSVVQDVAIGAVTGGVGEAPLLAPQIMKAFGKLGKFYTAEKGYATTITQGLSRADNVYDAVNKTANSLKVLDKFRYGLAIGTSAIAEGSFEANQTFRNIKENLTQEYIKKYGYEPGKADVEQIEEFARGGGNADMLGNVALLSLTNSAVFGTIFKPFNAAQKSISTAILGADDIALKSGSLDIFEQAVKPKSKFNIIANSVEKVSRPVRVSAIEGVEEGSQFLMQRSAEDYYKRKFNDSEISNVDNFVKSLSTGLKDTLTTREGLENVFLGILSGTVIHASRGLIERGKGLNTNHNNLINSTVSILNNQRLSGIFRNTYDEAVTATSIAKDMEKAVQQNDIFEYQNLKFQQLFNFVESGVRTNRYDLRVDQLNMLKDLKPQEFEQMFGITFSEENKKTAHEYVDSVINKAQDIKNNIDKVNRVFTNPYPVNTNNHLVFNEYKSQLALDLSEVADAKRRLSKITGEVAAIAPSVDIQNLMNLTNDKGLTEVISSFQKRVDELSDNIENFLEDKNSDFYKDQVAERSYLQKKIVDLRDVIEDYSEEEYKKHSLDIVNYYANGKTLKNNITVNPIDIHELLTKGQDAFKLVNSADSALYHYQQLTTKKGFDKFFADVVSEYNKQDDKFEQNNPFGTVAPTPPTDGKKEEIAVEGVEDITETGEPVKKSNVPPARPSSDITPEENKVKPNTKLTGVVNGKEAAITIGNVTDSKDKGTAANVNVSYKDGSGGFSGTATEEQINKWTSSKTENKQNLPEGFVDSSTPVEPLEFEKEPSVEKGIEKALEVKEEEGVVTNSIKYKADPSVLFNRIFTKDFQDGNKEKQNLREAIFSQDPASFYNTLTISMSEATQGLKKGEYKLFKPFKEIYYTGFDTDMTIFSNGKAVGKIQPVDRLFYKKQGNYIPLNEITPQDYERVTENHPSTYTDFVNQINDYKNITDKLKSDFKNGKTSYTNDEVKGLFDVLVRYGGIKFSKSDVSSTTLKDLEYRGKGSAVLSFPMVFNKELNLFQRSTRPEILNKAELTPEEIKDVMNFVMNNIDSITGQNRRYIYLMKLPDGKFHKFSALTARPGKATKEQLDSIFSLLKTKYVELTREKVKRINSTLGETVYVADSKNRKELKSNLRFSIGTNGNDNTVQLYLDIHNKFLNLNKRISITEARDAKNFDEMVDIINQKLARVEKQIPDLNRLGIRIEKQDFSKGLLNDQDITKEQLESNLTVSVPSYVFDDFSISIFPTGSMQKQEPIEKVTPKPSLVKLSPEEQSLLNVIFNNVEDISGGYKDGIKAVIDNPSQHIDVLSSVVSQYINDWETGRKVFGDKISDEIAKTIPQAAKAEAEKIKTFQTAQDAKGLAEIFKTMFGLKPKQAAAVADIYDRTADAWALRNNASKLDFYKKLVFQQAKQEDLMGDVLNQMESDPLVRELFRRKTFEPIGTTFVTNQVARERFNIDQLKEQNRFIGGGSDRDVYDLGDGKVVKIAKTARGLIQNDIENDQTLSDAGIIPKTFEIGDNYLVVEKVEPSDIYDYDIAEVLGKWYVVGTSQVSYLVDPDDQKMIPAKSQKDAIRIKQELQDKNSPRKFIAEFTEAMRNMRKVKSVNDLDEETKKKFLDKYGIDLSVIGEYDFLYGDFIGIQNWGVKNGKPIHLDGGTFDKTMINDTPERKLAEEDFKKIREKTNNLAKKFKDSDWVNKSTNQFAYPLYQGNLSNSMILANAVKGFELQPTQGFGTAYKTKTGTATPNLANKINKWLSDNGYTNIKFVYESTYKTVNPFIKQENLLFQTYRRKQKENQNILDSYAKKLSNIQIINILERIKDNEINKEDADVGFIIAELTATKKALQQKNADKENSLRILLDLFGNNVVLYLLEDKAITEKDAELLNSYIEKGSVPFFPDVFIDETKGIESINLLTGERNIEEDDSEFNNYLLNQQAKGAIRLADNGSAVIYALTNPDVSTPLHELAHFWEGQLTELEKADVLKWAGLGEEWTRETSEKFAVGFEKYLAEGKAPSSDLQKIFDNFKKWLKDIYKVIIGNPYFDGIELNDSMRKIYASMLGENFEQELKEEVKQEQKAAEVVEPVNIQEPAKKEGIIEYAARLEKMTDEQREEVDFYENNAGYEYYVAKKIMPKKANSVKFKKVTEDDTPLFDFDYIANIEGVPYGLSKDEDPDNPDDEKAFVYNYVRMDNPAIEGETYISDNKDMVDFLVKIHNKKAVEQTEPVVTQEIVEQPEQIEQKFEPEVFGQEDVGTKVIYQGKELTVEEVNTSAAGNTMLLVTDGSKYGQKYVTPDKVTKVKPTTEEVVEVFDEGLLKDLRVKDYEGDDATTSSKEDEDNLLIDYIGLKLVLENLKQRFNIPYKVVSVEENWRGKFENGVAVINLKYVTRDTPFHEYLHPFIAVLKVDNNELYNSLYEEFNNLLLENDDAAGEIMAQVVRNPYYKNKTKEEQREEGLIQYISRLSAKNINKESKTVLSQAVRAFQRLMNQFKEWLDRIIIGARYSPEEAKKLDKRKPLHKAGFVEDESKKGTTTLTELPTNMTAQDVADILSLHSMSFDLSNHVNLINKLNEFQAVEEKKEQSDEAKIIARIRRRLDVLEDTAKKRTPSDILLSEMIAIKAILKNPDEIESVNSYVQRGLDGLDFANDEFKRISTKLKGEEKLSPKDIQELSKSLSLVKNLLAFYDDVSFLFSRIVEDLDPKDYKYYSKILLQAENNGKYIKTRSVEIVTEWLYPFIEDFNEKIKEKYPEYLLTKEQFKNKLYTADEDSDFLFHWLGSVSSSSDPISAITRTALFDMMEENHIFEAELGEEIKITYDTFLKRTGLTNEIKQTEEYYRQNYLRKATVLERTDEKDKDDKYIYKYNQKWAFHEEFFFDLYVKEKDEFLESLGERPDEADKGYQEWVDKIFDWEKVNGSFSKPAERFRNPKFTDLYRKDEFFTKLYETYKDGNKKIGEHEELKYGVVPQVSRGKSAFNDIKNKEGVRSKAKEVKSKIVNFLIPQVEDETTFSDSQENLDGSIYRKIVVPYTRSLDEEDVSLVLPETVFKYAGATNLTALKREVDPNVTVLKGLLEGNNKFIKEARKINKVTSDRKTIFDHILKLPARKEEKVSRLNKQLTSWIDDVMYGVNESQDSVKILGRNIDLNKTGGNLAFLTALNNMAFNVTAGVGNVTIGNIMSFGESLGGKYYNTADWRKASAQYFSSTNSFLKDAFNLRKSKITQLGIKYDAIQGEFRDKYGKKFVGNVAQRYASSDTIFFLNHAAEHQIQLVGMLALMNATKVKTNAGETISLFDAHIVNEKGFLRLRKDIEWSAEQEKDFTRRLHGINKVLNGNYSKFDKAHLQRAWYGKLLLIYRKFMYNAFRARYGRKRPDYEIGDSLEGYYRKFFTKLVSDIKDYKFEAVRKFYKKEGWTEDEKYAANKTLWELGLFVGTMLISIGVASAEDDDEDKSWGQEYLSLQLLRLRSDIGMYSVFGATDIMKVIQNPSAVILTLKRYADVIGQIIKNPFETYDRKTGTFDKGDSILKAKVLKALPIIRQFINLLQPEEQAKFYKLLNKY